MLPFHISRMFGLKSKTHGFALVNEQGIKLVFRDAADIASAPDDDADSLMIEWSNLAEWKAKRGLLSDEFTMKVHHIVGDEPDGKNDNILELQIPKRDRDKLDRFEKHVKEYQNGTRRDDVDDVLDDVRDLLDNMLDEIDRFRSTRLIPQSITSIGRQQSRINALWQ